jgi:hypothetical protein
VNANHTACLYAGTNETRCGTTGRIRGLTAAEKDAIVSAHNDKRRTVANGQQANQPPAANMIKMIWDNEAADIAQLWVDQCLFSHDLRRDTVLTGGVQWNGQNMYWAFGSSTLNVGGAVNLWYNEVTKFNATAQLNPFVFTSGTGHYSQVVWARSARVGCGFIFQNNQQIFACNYAPAGNVQRSVMYITGTACSACPSTHPICDNGLCTTA